MIHKRDRSISNETTKNVSSQNAKFLSKIQEKCDSLVNHHNADPNGNSPAPTINSDDDGIFESQEDSPGYESPVERRLTVVKKSRSEGECNIEIGRVRQSSAELCSSGNQPEDVQVEPVEGVVFEKSKIDESKPILDNDPNASTKELDLRHNALYSEGTKNNTMASGA
ncbi:unnamed protein product [Nesidiocoris tenuis]|uniref:Uncharacterized protein n=1 Tax=Nesidiocoris tenuis TaxID=355587 RepID=A0A6H5HC58_9HEMI|nr:unnamed protein product [Nesidiocoris tenuis]